jgi:hypothetical protein
MHAIISSPPPSLALGLPPHNPAKSSADAAAQSPNKAHKLPPTALHCICYRGPPATAAHRPQTQVIGRKRAANYGADLRRAVYRCFQAYEKVKAARRAWDRWAEEPSRDGAQQGGV